MRLDRWGCWLSRTFEDLRLLKRICGFWLAGVESFLRMEDCCGDKFCLKVVWL